MLTKRQTVSAKNWLSIDIVEKVKNSRYIGQDMLLDLIGNCLAPAPLWRQTR